METKLEKALKKEIIWCVWYKRLHTLDEIIRNPKRFEYPYLYIKDKGT